MERLSWFRLRHRKSRAEVVAFAMGIKVGRELVLAVGPEEAEVIGDRVIEEMRESYS